MTIANACAAGPPIGDRPTGFSIRSGHQPPRCTAGRSGQAEALDKSSVICWARLSHDAVAGEHLRTSIAVPLVPWSAWRRLSPSRRRPSRRDRAQQAPLPQRQRSLAGVTLPTWHVALYCPAALRFISADARRCRTRPGAQACSDRFRMSRQRFPRCQRCRASLTTSSSMWIEGAGSLRRRRVQRSGSRSSKLLGSPFRGMKATGMFWLGPSSAGMELLAPSAHHVTGATLCRGFDGALVDVDVHRLLRWYLMNAASITSPATVSASFTDPCSWCRRSRPRHQRAV